MRTAVVVAATTGLLVLCAPVGAEAQVAPGDLPAPIIRTYPMPLVQPVGPRPVPIPLVRSDVRPVPMPHLREPDGLRVLPPLR
jgi:hypothetical protein